jgi:hypothetical protein
MEIIMSIKWALLGSLNEYRRIANDYTNYVSNSGLSIEQIHFLQDPENPLKDIAQAKFDIYQVPTSLLYRITERPWLKIWEFPFLFQSREHVENYINSEHARNRLKELETEDYIPMLTYSYAGGFCYAVKNRHQPIKMYNSLPFIHIQNNPPEKVAQLGISEIPLPHTMLAYEAEEYTYLKPEVKDQLEIEISNHQVIARVTFISRKAHDSLGRENINQLLSMLNNERNIIYREAEEKLGKLLEDKHLKHSYTQEDEKASWRMNTVSSDLILNAEIRFVQSLL